jgi:hypothetical protein
MENFDTRIESLLKFLIEQHLIDNSEESETLSKFI